MKVKRFFVFFVAGILLAGLILTAQHSFASTSERNYSKSVLKRMIVQEAKRQGVCPYLALSVAKQESNFNVNAVSHAGAIGLFQLMPPTARDLNVNPYVVEQNIRGGIRYLKMMHDQFGSTRLALAAYNAGPGAVQRFGGVPPYKETQGYVRYVMNFYNTYKQNPDPALL